MSWYTNSSQQETYQTVKDYLAGRRYKILVSNSPSYVRAAFGSYLAMSLSTVTAKGEIEASIMKSNDGSYVDFNFDFTKGYLAGFISAILGALVCYAGAYWGNTFNLSNVPSWAIGDASRTFNAIMIGVMFFVFVILMSLEGYYVSRTRRRFIQEFNMFAHSLPGRNQGVEPIKKP